MELAGETTLAAIVAGEPATVLFTGMLSKESRDLDKIMEDPKSHYTAELQKRTREKIAKIECPILICQGDEHPINNVNNAVFIPELKQAGKDVTVITYPGQPHSFFFGSISTGDAGQKVFDDAHSFLKKHLPTQPAPLDESLVQQVSIGRK